MSRYRIAYRSARARARQERATAVFAREGRELWRQGVSQLQARVAEVTEERDAARAEAERLRAELEAAQAHAETCRTLPRPTA
ncbi:MAG TPA: hypothetical protein VFY14_19450 [Streptomyces sp.]|nr:hypothetical protein [Streptomyces sp.]